jgi:uncharacterized damage-inducible protein DinB
MDLEKYRYPIGRFDAKQDLNETNFARWAEVIAFFPEKIEKVVSNLSVDQLSTPYRPGGWTVAQLVHHIADSHLNSYIRFKWTMTEDNPAIKAYDQREWAKLPDARSTELSSSLMILNGVHARWTTLLNSLSHEDFQRKLSHPDWDHNLTLGLMLSLYAWHCDHHLAHITELIKREGW